jgi:hypothetical protein
MIWIVVYSQTLYDDEYEHCAIFNQNIRITVLEAALEETEIRMRETTIRLKEAFKRSEDAYNDLLKMYGSQITLTGKIQKNALHLQMYGTGCP